MDDDLRRHSRFRTAVLDALDATHMLHPLGGVGDALHNWVRESMADHWGEYGPTGGYPEPSDRTAMINLAARYESWRAEGLADNWSLHPHHQAALFDSGEPWHRFTVDQAHHSLSLDRGDVRCVLSMCPCEGSSANSRWRLAVEERESRAVACFEGTITDRIAGSSVEFPDDLIRRPDWSGLLLQGLAELG
ncbi:hypothetical protein [Streptomyces sp. NPDC006691]|uniref:hypothetical protein n=1 Tax=Streptomyces sp. NPDC006691 TaxID=3364757 RepID=UPI00369910C4